MFVKTETTKNGETETKEYSKKLEAGEGVDVQVNAKATNEETSSEVLVDGEVVEATIIAENPAQAQLATSVVADISAFFTASVPTFFKKVIGFFWEM
jgi:hypothetical protein